MDSDALKLAANAAAEYVEDLKPDEFLGQSFTPSARTLLGAAMLAHRWYSRRASPLGVAGYAEFGSAGILRYDPDIARLLGIGTESGRFVFGAPTGAAAVEELPDVAPVDAVYVDPSDPGVLVINDGAI